MPEERSHERLDRTRILTAAARIVGEEGLKALTMRRIGAELGVDPTAVYRHFRNKEEILTYLAEWLFDNEPDVDPAASWQERLRASIDHALERYQVHEDLGILLARQDDDIKPLINFRERVLDVLINGARLDIHDAVMFSHMIEYHVIGNGLFFAIADYPESAGDYCDRMRRSFALLSAGEYPLVTEAAPFLFPDPKEVFDRMTDLLIEAVEKAGHLMPKEVTQ